MIDSIHIAGFELRGASPAIPPHNSNINGNISLNNPSAVSSSPYYVYEVVLSDGDRTWSVWRRFSDFVRLQEDFLRDAYLSSLTKGCRLPSRIPPSNVLWNQLVSTASNTANANEHRETKEFIAKRAEALQANFLNRLPQVKDKYFWRHPVLVSFFDVPLSTIGSTSAETTTAHSLSTMVTAGSYTHVENVAMTESKWMEKLRKAEDLLSTLQHIVQRQRQAPKVWVPSTIYPNDSVPSEEYRIMKNEHAIRLIKSIEKLASELQDTLPRLVAGTGSQGESPQLLRQQSLDRLRYILNASINELPTAMTTPRPPDINVGRLGGKQSPSPLPSPNNSRYSASSPLYHESESLSAPSEVLQMQAVALNTQDAQLSQISLALRRQKLLAQTINETVEEESKALNKLQSKMQTTRAKLDKSTEKAQRL